MKFDLGWGNSVCVREALLEHYLGAPLYIGSDELLKYDYPDHSGDPKAVEITRQVIKRQIGKEYKHIFLVNGATGGCVIAMRAYQQRGKENCVTRNAPYYIRYPRMIRAAGLMHIDQNYWQADAVALVDVPSNPLGLFDNIASTGVPVILDGVYLNRVYTSGNFPVINHEVYVGSYSKLLGINGIRLGWIATNDDILAERIKDLVASEYCGISTASTDLLKQVTFGLNWEKFEIGARWKLDANREEFSQLERFLDGTPIPDVGMFYYTSMDKKAQEIFTKANVGWTKGSDMGTDDGFARFNLGQNNDYISEAVQAILKADRIRK